MIFDIVAVVFAVVLSLVMMKKGGVKAALSLGSLVLSVFTASLIYPVITDAVYKTPLDENVETIVREAIAVENESSAAESFDSLPDFIKNVADIAENAVAEQITDAIAVAVTRVIINVVIFILLIIITKIVLAVLSGTIGILVKLPVLHQLNSLVGLCCGAATSLVVIYLAVILVSSLAAGNPTVAGWIENSRIVEFMSNTAA